MQKLPVDTLFAKADKSVADKRFHNAINYYDQIIKYYSDGKHDYRAKFMKGFVYAENLNQPKKAVQLFKEVLEYPKYPDVPKDECALHESAQYMIDEIEGKTNLLEKIEKMPADVDTISNEKGQKVTLDYKSNISGLIVLSTRFLIINSKLWIAALPCRRNVIKSFA